MNLYQAREITIQELIGLMSEVTIQIKPHMSRTNLKTVKKYSHRLPPPMWLNVQFNPETQEQITKIKEARDRLRKLNIYFDTGAGADSIEWELDWSFHINDNEDSEKDIENVLGTLDELTDKLMKIKQ